MCGIFNVVGEEGGMLVSSFLEGGVLNFQVKIDQKFES